MCTFKTSPYAGSIKINLKSIFSKKSSATVEIVDKKDEKVANQEVSE